MLFLSLGLLQHSLCYSSFSTRAPCAVVLKPTEILVLWWNMSCNFYHMLTEQVSKMPGFLEMHYMVTESDEKKWCSLLHLSEQQD